MVDITPHLPRPSRPTHRTPVWVDDYWALALSVPLVVAFVPGQAQHVSDGFAALAHAPGWYEAAVGSAVAFALGKRTLRGVRLSHLPKPLVAKEALT